MSNENEVAERLRRLESTLDRIDRRVALLYWICVLVLALYGLTALAALLVSGAADATASQFLFPACIVGAAVLVFLLKRRPEP